MIKVFVTGGPPCENIINKCMQTVVDQTCRDWEMSVVLDPFNYRAFFKDPRIKVHVNSSALLSMANLVKAVSLLNMRDDDIMVFLDGDDWLYDRDVFNKINEVYDDDNILVTHGSFTTYPAKPGYGRRVNNPYTKEEFKNLRGSQWRGSHLKTMKYRVFKNIRDEDFRGADGEYTPVGYDMDIMFPALEMVGYDRVRHIDQILYVYNVSGIRVPNSHPKESSEHEKHARSRKPYDVLASLTIPNSWKNCWGKT